MRLQKTGAFFVVLARDSSEVERKAKELEDLGYPYVIFCGENLNLLNVVFREPKGKYHAVNFSSKYVPEDTEIVALNDVDTEIHNLEAALRLFNEE